MRRRGNRRKALPQEPVQLEISKLSHEGRGIAHLEGKVVFVDEALPGEEVEARYTERRGTHDQARTVTVLHASPQRVEAPCPHYGLCGGCSLQHMEPAAQVLFKEAMLHEMLGHSLGQAVNYEHYEAITGPRLGYRRKARLGVRYIPAKQKVLVGFREKYSNFITLMDSCAVLHPAVSDLIPVLSECIQGLTVFRQIAQVEVAVGEGPSVQEDDQVGLVLRNLAPLPPSDQQQLLEFAQAHQVQLYLQPKGPDSLVKLYPDDAQMRLHYHLPDYDLKLVFHPLDFTQVNRDINRQMLNRALELLAPGPEDRVLDLFCGLGNFTLPLARQAAWVCGVEGVQTMVERGEENARANSIENVSFHCADLTQPVADAAWARQGFNKILLDPPRSGALEVLPQVVAFAPERIVYVSCNPATLARDAAELQSLGYVMQGAGVLDMFPHTAHVESMALFVRQ